MQRIKKYRDIEETIDNKASVIVYIFNLLDKDLFYKFFLK